MPEAPERRLLLTSGRLFLGTAQDGEALAFLRLPLNWASLFEMAEREGMGGVLAFQLRRLAQAHAFDLPLDPFTEALHHIFASNGALFAELSALREGLRHQGLQAILLKGGALIETVYRGHPGLRPVSDLDLLIKTPDLPAFTEILAKRGFRPLPSSTFFTNGSAAFDIHTDLVGEAWTRRKRLAFRFDDEALWREASPLDSRDPTFLILSPPHQILHLAVHALKHSFSRLIWFVDLGLLVGWEKWEELLDWAEDFGALRPLAYALFGLNRLMGVEVPQEILARLPRFNGIERRFLQGVINRRAMETPGEVMVVFSIPDLLGKLGYLLELSFPKREVLARHYPSTPSWLRYPHRLLRLAALGVQDGRTIAAFLKRRNG